MAVNRSGAVQVRGLKELRAEAKQLEDPKAFEAELRDVHYRVANEVVSAARPKMAQQGKLGASAAETMKANRSGVAARMSLGSEDVPWALGVEFGAKQNLRRIIKNTRRYRGVTLDNGSGRRLREGGRATIVRDDEVLDDVIGRIRSQSIDFTSRTNQSKRFRGLGSVGGVDVATYAGGRRRGQAIVMRGWNQFRPWRGVGPQAGYAIYPTIRAKSDSIVRKYEDEVRSILRPMFPN